MEEKNRSFPPSLASFRHFARGAPEQREARAEADARYGIPQFSARLILSLSKDWVRSFDSDDGKASRRRPPHAAAAGASAGSTTWKAEPAPGALSAQMRPPWASAMPLQIVSPRPAPLREARSPW